MLDAALLVAIPSFQCCLKSHQMLRPTVMNGFAVVLELVPLFFVCLSKWKANIFVNDRVYCFFNIDLPDKMETVTNGLFK